MRELQVSLLPLRMHVDQDALNCLLRFFSLENLRGDATPAKQTEDRSFFRKYKHAFGRICIFHVLLTRDCMGRVGRCPTGFG